MDADAQPDRVKRYALQVQGAGHSVAGPPEGDDKAIALALLDRPHPVMGVHEPRQRAVEVRNGGGHLLGHRFPQRC
jgi:hypothetical protein